MTTSAASGSKAVYENLWPLLTEVVKTLGFTNVTQSYETPDEIRYVFL